MHAIVSLLDHDHYRQVEEVWAELERRFGLRGAYATPYPHVTYQVAQEYDLDRLEPLLEQAAQTLRPFRMRTSGLGIFTAAAPVVYIPAVRSDALSRCHQTVWSCVEGCGTGVLDYYREHRWVPHITLGEKDISPALLPKVVEYLASLSFDWEIEVDNLALVWNAGARQDLRLRLPFWR